MGAPDGVATPAVEQALERLSPAQAGEDSALVASHRQRYELAAGLLAEARVLDLCCGTGYGSAILAERAASVHGVDIDAEAIAAARAAFGGPSVTFTAEDALAHLRGLTAGTVDAVVCFEGIEHVPDPAAVVFELARLRAAGARVILSIPNSEGFEEDNPFHVTSFGHEQAMALVEPLTDRVVLLQQTAEGSLLTRADAPLPDGGDVTARLTPGDVHDPAWANHWVVCAGIDPQAVTAASARLRLVLRNHDNEYMRALEVANARLLEANQRMARGWLGVWDTAAATIVARFEAEVGELREALTASEAEVAKWRGIADHNDAMYQQELRWRSARRYMLVDALRDRVVSLPGVKQVHRAVTRD